MPPRKRSQPQPPNRNRSRARTPGQQSTGEGTTDNVVGRRLTPAGRPITPRTNTLATAIEAFELGDDTMLFPYDPTDTSNPARPRTQKAGYNRATRELRIMFREGAANYAGQTAVYVYRDVPPRVWTNFQRVRSPGKFINRVLNGYDYECEYLL